MKVIDLKVLEKVSKKGNLYKAIFAILEDNTEIFICFVK